jgi:hypothetical protein
MALMLIDTPDSRYRGEPDGEPEPPRRARWHPNLRFWLPIVASVVCFIVAFVVPPFVMFVLTIAAVMFFCDGILSLVPMDGLRSHRQ